MFKQNFQFSKLRFAINFKIGISRHTSFLNGFNFKTEYRLKISEQTSLKMLIKKHLYSITQICSKEAFYFENRTVLQLNPAACFFTIKNV